MVIQKRIHNFVTENATNKYIACKTNMAKPIRTIPTLFGEEAKKFEEQAIRTEENPGTITIPKHDIELVRNVLLSIGM